MTKTYMEYQPSTRLREHIECFWTLEASSDCQQIVVPDGCMDILLRFDKALYAIDVIGSMTYSEQAKINAGHRYLGVRFRPGRLYQFVPVDCSKIVNGSIPLQSLINRKVSEFSNLVSLAYSNEDMIEILERTLFVQSSPLSGQYAIDALVAKDGNICSAELTEIAKLSERQLLRQCIQLTGLSPKVLSRVLRFRKAHTMLHSKSQTALAEIALDCGYSDQAHFSHDFAKFVGLPPSCYLKAVG